MILICENFLRLFVNLFNKSLVDLLVCQSGYKQHNCICGSGALPCKMLVVRIIENNKIDAYFRSGEVR